MAQRNGAPRREPRRSQNAHPSRGAWHSDGCKQVCNDGRRFETHARLVLPDPDHFPVHCPAILEFDIDRLIGRAQKRDRVGDVEYSVAKHRRCAARALMQTLVFRNEEVGDADFERMKQGCVD